jgi:hypothetical protein
LVKIFVSYARESAQAVRSLATDVEALAHTVWFDGDLSGGNAWWNQILAQIRDCQVFMVALSPESLDSVACKRELGYAADLGKPILPILIAEGVALQLLPPKLSQIHYVDYREPDRTSAFHLARALSALPAAPAIPDPLPEPPAAPVSYIGGIAEQIANATSLTDKDQSALLVDLRRSLRDRETAADARKLLERLRKRDDLLAKIGDEIDDLLETQPKAPGGPPDRSDRGTARQEAEASARTEEAVSAGTSRETGLVSPPRTSTVSATAPQALERFKCAMYGLFIGFALGMAIAAAGFGGLMIPMAMTVGGTVAGAISAMRLHVMRVAIGGGVLGGIAAVVIASLAGEGGMAVSMGFVFGVSPGTVVGAVVGTLIAKKRSGG